MHLYIETINLYQNPEFSAPARVEAPFDMRDSSAFLWVPVAAFVFYFLTQIAFTITYFDSDDFVARDDDVGYPVLFVDDEFDGFKAFLARFVVAVTNADQLVAILIDELFCAVLTRMQSCLDFHDCPLQLLIAIEDITLFSRTTTISVRQTNLESR